MVSRILLISSLLMSLLLVSCSYQQKPSQLPITCETSFISEDGLNGIARIDSIAERLNQLYLYQMVGDSLIEKSRVLQPFPIYRFYSGRIDNDPYPELFLGVKKRNRFDPEYKKRLFIYSVREFSVEPKWLGTHLVHELIDFKLITVGDLSHIITFEKTEEDSFAVLEYNWIDFGPELLNYRVKGGSYEEVYSYFNSVN